MKLITGSFAALCLASGIQAMQCADGTALGTKPTLTPRTGSARYCKAKNGNRNCYEVNAEGSFVDADVESVADKNECQKELFGKWRSVQTDGNCAVRTCNEKSDTGVDTPPLAVCGAGQRRGWTYHYQENASSGKCKPDRTLQQWEKVCVPKCGPDAHLVSNHEDGVCQEPVCTETQGDNGSDGSGLVCAADERKGPSVYVPRMKGTYCKATDKGSKSACVPNCGDTANLRAKETCNEDFSECHCAEPECVPV